jgi:SAM-dependent methyltransferase
MYGELASWFHLVTAPADYAHEAEDVVRLLADHGVELGPANPDATLLELGSGGGNTASHLKARAHLTLTDIAPSMLALSMTLNPECEHVEGDMRTLRLGRTFDVVLLHDAVTYMTTEADLRAAMETAYTHLRPGGVVILIPDFTAETFQPRTEHGGHDGHDGRSLRYLEWTYDPNPLDTTVVTDYCANATGRRGCSTTGTSRGSFRERRGWDFLSTLGSGPMSRWMRGNARCSSGYVGRRTGWRWRMVRKDAMARWVVDARAGRARSRSHREGRWRSGGPTPAR